MDLVLLRNRRDHVRASRFSLAHGVTPFPRSAPADPRDEVAPARAKSLSYARPAPSEPPALLPQSDRRAYSCGSSARPFPANGISVHWWFPEESSATPSLRWWELRSWFPSPPR